MSQEQQGVNITSSINPITLDMRGKKRKYTKTDEPVAVIYKTNDPIQICPTLIMYLC